MSWQPGDFDAICAALEEELAELVLAGQVTIWRAKPTKLVLRGDGARWEIDLREKSSGNVYASISPNQPPFTDDEMAALRRAAKTSQLAQALRSSGGWWEKKLAERLQRHNHQVVMS